MVGRMEARTLLGGLSEHLLNNLVTQGRIPGARRDTAPPGLWLYPKAELLKLTKELQADAELTAAERRASREQIRIYAEAAVQFARRDPEPKRARKLSEE